MGWQGHSLHPRRVACSKYSASACGVMVFRGTSPGLFSCHPVPLSQSLLVNHTVLIMDKHCVTALTGGPQRRQIHRQEVNGGRAGTRGREGNEFNGDSFSLERWKVLEMDGGMAAGQCDCA